MSLGKVLREERERQGLSISDVAKETHILEQMISELENDDFHRIAAEIYGRGFIKIYAKQLKIDPSPLLNEFSSIFRKDGGISAVPQVPRVALERFGNRAGDSIEVIEPEPELKDAKTNEEKKSNAAVAASGNAFEAKEDRRTAKRPDSGRFAPLLDLFENPQPAKKADDIPAPPAAEPPVAESEPASPAQLFVEKPSVSDPAPVATATVKSKKSLFDVGSGDVPVITKSKNGVSLPSLAPVLSETSILSRTARETSVPPTISVTGTSGGRGSGGIYSGVLDSASDHFSGHPFRPGFGRVFDSLLVSIFSGIMVFFVMIGKGISIGAKSVWKAAVFLASAVIRSIMFCVRGISRVVVAAVGLIGHGLVAGGKIAGQGIGRGAVALGSGLSNGGRAAARLPWGLIIKVLLAAIAVMVVLILISSGVRSCQASRKAAAETEKAAGPMVYERLLEPPAGFAD